MAGYPWEDPATIGQTDEEILAQLMASDPDAVQAAPPPPVSPGPPPAIDPALAGAPTVDGLAAAPSQEEYDAQIWRELEAQAGGEPVAPPQAPPAPAPPGAGPQPTPGQQANQGPQPVDPYPEYQPTAYQPETAGAYQAGKIADLEADKADVVAGGMRDQAAIGRARMEQMEIDRVARAKHLQETEAKLERERQAIMATDIDENQWWDSQPTGQRLAFIAGGAISGFLDVSLGRGPGHGVVPIMQSLIEKNLATQKANLAKRENALQEGHTLYARLMERYKNEDVADSLFTGMAIENEQRNTAAQLAQFGSREAKERGVAVMMEMDEAKRAEYAKATAALEQQIWDRDVKERELRRQSYEARTGRMNAETNQKELAIKQQDADTRELTAKKTNAGWEVSDGKGGVLHTFRTEKQAEEAVKMYGAGLTLDALGAQGKELFADGGWDNNPLSARRARQEAWVGSWVNATKTADGDFSAPNAFDFESRAPKDGWGPDQISARIDEQTKTGRTVARTKLAGMGVPEDRLKTTGWVDPPGEKEVPRAAKTSAVLFYDEKTGKVGPNIAGPTATPEQIREAEEQEERERYVKPDKMSNAEWAYQKQQNDWAARQGKPPPFPNVLPRKKP